MTTRQHSNALLKSIMSVTLFVLGAAAFAPVFADNLLLGGCNSSTSVSVNSGGATVPCSGSVSGPLGLWFVTYSFTEAGDLSAGTSGVTATVTNSSPSIYGGGSYSAYVQVTYIFNGLGVSDGTAAFDIATNGTLSSSGGGDPEMEFEFYEGSWTVNGGSVPGQTTFLGNGASNLVLDAPISNGTTELQYALFAEVTCPGGPSCATTTDFLDPFNITGASAYDASGNLVSGATFVSESGFNPNASTPVPTPEPSSLLLLGAGLLALIGARKFKVLTV